MPHAYMLTAPRTLELREYQDPAELGPREVRLQSVLSGISHGTEMNLYRGTAPFAEKHFDGQHRLFVPNQEPGFQPMGLGYELVSRVLEVGRSVTEVAVGDLVHTAANHRPTSVVNLDDEARSQIPLQVLPESVNPASAVFAALVGVALAAIHDAQIKVGDDVAIFGMGTIGLILVQLARQSGALHITAIDPISKRREMAARLGADLTLDPTTTDPAMVLKHRPSGPCGPDVVLEASGNYRALQSAIRTAHMGGNVVTLGYYQGGATPLQLGEEWHHNRLNLISSMAVWQCPSRYAPMWDRPRITRTAVSLLERGLVQVEGLITQRFDYLDAPLAYQFIDEHPDETIKAVLVY
jgi:2-desacetyl-2-hydroxyethyl bacteriochlorophyllide A dehydrogenase